MRNTVAKVTGIVLAMGWVGCGGDSERTPPEKCEDLIADLCARGVECIPGASGMQSACVQAIHQSITCSGTKSVSANYDSCIDAVHDSSCSALVAIDSGNVTFKLPSVCSSVLLGLAPPRSDTLSLAAEPGDPGDATQSDAIDELATRAGAALASPAD